MKGLIETVSRWRDRLVAAGHDERSARAEIHRAIRDRVVRLREGSDEPAVDELAGLDDELRDAGDDILGQLHERLLARDAKARKAGGAFYTPAHVVQHIIHDTVGALLASDPARPIRVLDPACGGGFFLLEAARQLFAARPGADRARLVADSIHGVDLDPIALDVTRTSLELCAGTPVNPCLVAGNSLLDVNRDREFPAAMAAGGFDVVVANPPYLNLKRGFISDDDKARLEHSYRSAVGQYDAFVLFLELALRLLRPGGRLGFLLPKPVLVSENYEVTRRLVFAATRIESVIDCGRPFPDAGVEAVAIIATRRDETGPAAEPGDHRVAMARLGTRADAIVPLGTARQAALVRTPFAGWSYLVDDAALDLLDHIRERGTPLGKLCVEFDRGIEAGKGALTRTPTGTHSRPTLRGQDVTAFTIRDAGWFYDATPDNRPHWKSADRYAGEKVLVRRVADRPIAAVDADGFWVLNTLYILRPQPGVRAGWLAACLNSRLLAWVFRVWFLSDDRLFPYLRKSQLSQLPIPDPRELPPDLVDGVTAKTVDDVLAHCFGLSTAERELVARRTT